MMPSAKTFVHRQTARQPIILEFCARATRKEDVCGYSEYEREVHSASNQLRSTAVSDQAALPPEDGAKSLRSESFLAHSSVTLALYLKIILIILH